MTIVEGLIASVREACAARAKDLCMPGTAEGIGAGNAQTKAGQIATAGLAEIARYFEDYEEVEVWQRKDSQHLCLPSCLLHEMCEPSPDWPRKFSILIPKPAPEMRTVSRETLAVLAEHYEATPDKDTAGDAALTEAKRAL